MSVDGSHSARGSRVDFLRMSDSRGPLSRSSQRQTFKNNKSSMISSVDSESGQLQSKTQKATEKLLGDKLEKEIKKAILDVMKVDVDT
jgi:hypothetical protein